MDPKSFRISLIAVFIFTLVILYSFNATPINLPTQSSSNVVVTRDSLNPKEFPNYKIDGMDRFEWYTKKWKEELKNEKPPEVEEVTLLRAYEFDVEYSISITTPNKYKAIVYCRYFGKNGTEMLPAFQSYNFPEFVVNCQKRKGTHRLSVSTQANNSYTYPIELIDRTQKVYDHEFSFCMSNIYGKEPKWLQLSEIIEHYKLQGMTHFYFYVFHIDEYSNALLQDYVRTGEATVTHFLERNDRELLHWQIVAFRDCTLRTRHVSKWSLFSDIDERLLMTKYPGTILDYLREVKDDSVAGIQFRQQWIMKTEFLPEKYEGDKQVKICIFSKRNFKVFRLMNGLRLFVGTILPLSDHQDTLSNALPSMMYPGYHIHELKPEEGLVRHYRDLQMWNWGKTWLKEIVAMGPMSMTDYPAKYQKNLTDAVKTRTKYVYENYHPREE
ncbi:Protein CBG09519 [Caenorhabditis briggsae]|uniref:Glycosyltransferase family 92 protein n=2 Tax=Caenorhabditis briggsae TaxID=6238 RepID=A8X8X2_CAEBR|nr:Protein CBG09519 [Caenorhabditis briggsae]CAP29083.2 Protein CBG09519 [Caenorhabditis briggsae]